jgi:hypothetical protein
VEVDASSQKLLALQQQNIDLLRTMEEVRSLWTVLVSAASIIMPICFTLDESKGDRAWTAALRCFSRGEQEVQQALHRLWE